MGSEPRPAISGSMCGHCRVEIWLLAHGGVREEVLPGTQRTFDLGFIVEAAMLRSITVDIGLPAAVEVGPWFPHLGEVRDPATGKSFDTGESLVTDFQKEVSFAGYKGHIDGILRLSTGNYLLDVKTTQGHGFKRHKTNNLMLDPFAREYVCQLHFYMQGLMDEGYEIHGGMLLFYNKENSQVMARFVDYDPVLVAEIKERLSWATKEGEPEPDWAWSRGSDIPMRCGYCGVKEACAELRGLSLGKRINKNGRPEWFVPVLGAI